MRTSRVASRTAPSRIYEPRLLGRLDDGVIWEADFENLFPLSTAANQAAIRALLDRVGLTHTRASSATVQTGTETVVSLSTDDPGIGNLGQGRGLQIEESRTNRVPNSNPSQSAWVVGGGTPGNTLVATTPDSTNTGRRIDDNDASAFEFYSLSMNNAPNGTQVTASFWSRSISGTQPYVQWNGGHGFVAGPAAASGTWSRSSAVANANATSPFNVNITVGNTTAGTGIADFWGLQLEDGAFATSLINTSGATATRQATRLRTDLPALLIDRGRLTLEVELIMLGASSGYGGSRFLMYGNAIAPSRSFIDQWFINASKQIVVQTADGSFTTSALAWNQFDRLNLVIESGGSNLRTRVVYRTRAAGASSYGSRVVVGESTAPQGTVYASPMDLLQGTATGVLSSVVCRIRAWAHGRRPAWAA